LLFDNDMTSLELELLSSLPSLAALYEWFICFILGFHAK
jgi:hypothetical protein